jgi:putative membrane protein
MSMDGGGQARLDVDARFLLANERTLLAWVRTGLALQAGGVGVFQVADRLAARELIALALLALGMACHCAGWWRYRVADRQLRLNRLPNRGVAPDLVALVIVLLSLAMAVALLVA